jgi:predicted nucleic acid-binding protein
MKITKVYLETTIFNFPYADDAPDKKQAALTLFDEIKAGKYQPYTSGYVIEELVKNGEPKQSKMLQRITDYHIEVLPYSDEVERLADRYIAEGIIPASHELDARHIAATSVYRLDSILSYNFRHIVKHKTIKMVEAVNILEGYNKIDIFSPEEVIDYEGD